MNSKISSSIVFTAENIIMEEDEKEISEIKSFGALGQYLLKLAHEIFKVDLWTLLLLASGSHYQELNVLSQLSC